MAVFNKETGFSRSSCRWDLVVMVGTRGSCERAMKRAGCKEESEPIKRSHPPIQTNLGDILGCDLANFTINGKPNSGKNRLYRIIASGTAFLIWKLMNERRIRGEDGQEQRNIDAKTTNRSMGQLVSRRRVKSPASLHQKKKISEP